MMSSGAVGVRSSDTRRRATCLEWTNEPKRAVLVLQRDDGLTATPRLFVQELKINVTQLNLIKLTISDQSISSLHFPANFRYRVFSSSGHLRRWWWWRWRSERFIKKSINVKLKSGWAWKTTSCFRGGVRRSIHLPGLRSLQFGPQDRRRGPELLQGGQGSVYRGDQVSAERTHSWIVEQTDEY